MSELLEAPTLPRTDRRNERRYQPTFGTLCHLRVDDHFESGESGLVWDVSQSGLGLLLTFAPEMGLVMQGDMRTEDGRGNLPVEFRVAHIRQLETGDYFIGARFLRRLTLDECEPFVTPYVAEPPAKLTDLELG